MPVANRSKIPSPLAAQIASIHRVTTVQSGNYTTSINGCTCKDYQFRKHTCKHMAAVRELEAFLCQP